MPVQLKLSKAIGDNLECNHDRIWAGAVRTKSGVHMIPMDCATCVNKATAMDELRSFGLYVLFGGSEGATLGTAQPKVMTAGSPLIGL